MRLFPVERRVDEGEALELNLFDGFQKSFVTRSQSGIFHREVGVEVVHSTLTFLNTKTFKQFIVVVFHDNIIVHSGLR